MADITHGITAEEHLPRLTWPQFLEKYATGWRANCGGPITTW